MSKFLKAAYQQLEAYVPGEQPRDMQYIKLNTNESPFPPAPSVCNLLDDNDFAALRLYSDPTGKGLKEKLASLYKLEPENIFVANGSDDVLNFIFMAYGHKGAAFADITYGFYKVFSQLHGIEYSEIPLKEDFSLDYKDYCGLNKLIVIANPNAPTGMEIPLYQIEEILQTNPDSVVVIDEAYVDFGGTSCYPLISNYKNLIVTRTFSKSRCMAGARLGYAFGNTELIDDLEKLKYSTNPYNVNRMTLALGEATVNAQEYYECMCAQIAQVRENTAKALKASGFDVLPSAANFLFAKHPDIDGGVLYETLKKRGILVRHFTKPRICQYVRITIGTQAQMDTFLSVVKDIILGE